MSYQNIPKTQEKDAVVISALDSRDMDGAYGRLSAAAPVAANIIQPSLLGASIHVLPFTGVQLSAVSTSASDAVGGTGINSIHIHYIDTAFKDQDEILELNGTTPVNTVATDIIFVQCIHIVTYGTGKKAAGDITLNYSGTAVSAIPTGYVRCTSSARMIPAGYTFMAEDLFGSAGSSANKVEAFVEFGYTGIFTHDYTEDGILIPHMGITLLDSPVTQTLATPFPIPEKHIVALQVTSDNALFCTGGYKGYLKPNV